MAIPVSEKSADIEVTFSCSDAPGTPTGPFVGARLKIARARKHFGDLKEMLGGWTNSSPAVVDFRSNFDAKGNPQQAFLKTTWTPPDVEFGTIVGDIVHNLRSALDLLVVEAAGPKCEKAYFPFARSADDLARTIRRSNLDLAPEYVQELILTLKPYHGGDEKLRALHDLDLMDKHNRLIPAMMTATSPPVRADTSGGHLVFILDQTVAPKAVPTFPSNWPLAGAEVLPALENLVYLVETIIDRFSLAEDKQS